MLGTRILSESERKSKESILPPPPLSSIAADTYQDSRHARRIGRQAKRQGKIPAPVPHAPRESAGRRRPPPPPPAAWLPPHTRHTPRRRRARGARGSGGGTWRGRGRRGGDGSPVRRAGGFGAGRNAGGAGLAGNGGGEGGGCLGPNRPGRAGPPQAGLSRARPQWTMSFWTHMRASLFTSGSELVNRKPRQRARAEGSKKTGACGRRRAGAGGGGRGRDGGGVGRGAGGVCVWGGGAIGEGGNEGPWGWKGGWNGRLRRRQFLHIRLVSRLKNLRLCVCRSTVRQNLASSVVGSVCLRKISRLGRFFARFFGEYTLQLFLHRKGQALQFCPYKPIEKFVQGLPHICARVHQTGCFGLSLVS